MKSPLRDLADLIQRTAMEHPAYGQASASVLNCVDHLCAIARNEEANREMQTLTTLLDASKMASRPSARKCEHLWCAVTSRLGKPTCQASDCPNPHDYTS